MDLSYKYKYLKYKHKYIHTGGTIQCFSRYFPVQHTGECWHDAIIMLLGLGIPDIQSILVSTTKDELIMIIQKNLIF